MGLEIIKELALGIADALPELIPTIVDTVLMIVETLIDNIDMLIDAAIAITMALANGMIKALPRLIEKVPVIITKLIEALVANLPKLIEMGISLMIALAGGLIKAAPILLMKIPEIVASFVNGFGSFMESIRNIGKNIVGGIWDGIQAMGTWMSDKVSGFFNNIVGDINGILGIHSPSKIFAGIGQNMALGLGAGFATEMDSVARKINSSVPTSINVSGTTGGSGGGIQISTPVYLDGKLITYSTSRHQYGRNQSYSRAVGVSV
jgi:hypothetical protein